MKNRSVQFRTFLNAKQGLAAVEVNGNNEWVDLSITDCSRQVALSFNCSTTAERKAARAKLARLQLALDTVGKAINAD